MSEAERMANMSDSELEAEVSAILEQIKRDERRAQVIKTVLVLCGLAMAWAAGAVFALHSVGGL